MFRITNGYAEYHRDTFNAALEFAHQLRDNANYYVDVRDDNGLIVRLNQS